MSRQETGHGHVRPQAVDVSKGQRNDGDDGRQESEDGDVASNVNGLVGRQVASGRGFIGH